MPVYEYRCEKCGHQFEELQRITEDPIRKCPQCGRLAVERLISKTSFILKGSGWYVTDYARKSGGGDSGPKSGDKEPGSETSSSKETSPSKEASSGKDSSPPKDPSSTKDSATGSKPASSAPATS